VSYLHQQQRYPAEEALNVEKMKRLVVVAIFASSVILAGNFQ